MWRFSSSALSMRSRRIFKGVTTLLCALTLILLIASIITDCFSHYRVSLMLIILCIFCAYWFIFTLFMSSRGIIFLRHYFRKKPLCKASVTPNLQSRQSRSNLLQSMSNLQISRISSINQQEENQLEKKQHQDVEDQNQDPTLQIDQLRNQRQSQTLPGNNSIYISFLSSLHDKRLKMRQPHQETTPTSHQQRVTLLQEYISVLDLALLIRSYEAAIDLTQPCRYFEHPSIGSTISNLWITESQVWATDYENQTISCFVKNGEKGGTLLGQWFVNDLQTIYIQADLNLNPCVPQDLSNAELLSNSSNSSTSSAPPTPSTPSTSSNSHNSYVSYNTHLPNSCISIFTPTTVEDFPDPPFNNYERIKPKCSPCREQFTFGTNRQGQPCARDFITCSTSTYFFILKHTHKSYAISKWSFDRQLLKEFFVPYPVHICREKNKRKFRILYMSISKDRIFITYERDDVVELDHDGNFIASYEHTCATRIAKCENENIFFTCTSNSQDIIKISCETGEEIIDTSFTCPKPCTGLAYSEADCELYVACGNKVYVFDSSGSLE